MPRDKLFATVAAGLFAIAGIGSGALAQGNVRQSDEGAATANAKITVMQAIAAAEQQTGGRAVETDTKTRNGIAVFEVEIVKDNQKHKVIVDAQSGQVIRTALKGDDDRGRVGAIDDNGDDKRRVSSNDDDDDGRRNDSDDENEDDDDE
jgi:hypothetical protein